MKFVYFIFIMFNFIGCGVNTDSSGVPSSISDVKEDTNDTTQTEDTNNTAQVIDNTDTNDTTQTEDTTEKDPIFESDGAIYDENACKITSSTVVLSDHNQDNPIQTTDFENGISIYSQYYITGNIADSLVTLYYPVITADIAFKDDKLASGYYNGAEITLVYDVAWKDEPNNTIYMEIPKLDNKLKTCYKVILNGDDIDLDLAQKVYRY